jgi:hypothetical protein
MRTATGLTSAEMFFAIVFILAMWVSASTRAEAQSARWPRFATAFECSLP